MMTTGMLHNFTAMLLCLHLVKEYMNDDNIKSYCKLNQNAGEHGNA